MGATLSNEKTLDLVKHCSTANIEQENYKLEFQIGKEKKKYDDDDEESLDGDDISERGYQNSIYRNVKDVHASHTVP